MRNSRSETAFLFDVDNTLLDNDRIIADLQSHVESEVGIDCAEHYRRIFEDLRTEHGYADYLGALQRYRIKYPRDPAVLAVGRFLLDYPFADRLFPHALKVSSMSGNGGRRPSSLMAMWSFSRARSTAPACFKR